MRGRMSDRISLEVYQHENRGWVIIVPRLSVLQAPVPDDGLAALSEVNILPVGSRLLLLLLPFLIPPNHVCVASYLALCLAFVRYHIPGDHKEEECPHCLKETAGEKAVLKGPEF